MLSCPDITLSPQGSTSRINRTEPPFIFRVNVYCVPAAKASVSGISATNSAAAFPLNAAFILNRNSPASRGNVTAEADVFLSASGVENLSPAIVRTSVCATPATGNAECRDAVTGACVILVSPADSTLTEVILPAFGCNANMSFVQCLFKSWSATAGLVSLTVCPGVSEVA